jgi:hypothetical protein
VGWAEAHARSVAAAAKTKDFMIDVERSLNRKTLKEVVRT